jgi:hypothetical protein
VSPSLHFVRSPPSLPFDYVLIKCIRCQRKSDDKIELLNFDFLIPKLNAKSFVYNSFGHFLQTLKPNAHKTAQKTKNIFLKPVLKLNFSGTYFRSRTFHFVKKGQIVVTKCSRIYMQRLPKRKYTEIHPTTKFKLRVEEN